MELQVEELEPIITATATARLLSNSSPSRQEEEAEPRIVRRLERVAHVCMARMRNMDRSLFLLGKTVSRLSRHYDRDRGLMALSAYITKKNGNAVSGQRLGQARLVYDTYDRDEYENRVSHLSSTHLLKVAQAFPGDNECDLRNDLLDEAVRDNLAVSELISRIKRRKNAKVLEDSPESAPTTDEAAVEEARGYICDHELTELGTLPDREVEFLRSRSTVSVKIAIAEAGRVLSPTGLMIVELPGFAGYHDAHMAVKETGRLRILHTLIVLTPAIDRPAPRDLPVMDGFRVTVLIGGNGFRCAKSKHNPVNNPMSEAIADELIYSLVPDSGLIVDIGTGSIRTAEWARDNGRDFLAVEPNEDVHAKALADFEANILTDTSSEPTTPDLWPMVSKNQREQASIAGKPWIDMTCCDRTGVEIVATGVTKIACPVCGTKQSRTKGGSRC